MSELKQRSSLMPTDVGKKGMIACLVISAVIIGLYFVPYGHYILYPLSLVYTFIHEMGHGISALLIGGDFLKFEMWANGSGLATYRLPIDAGRLARAFTAFGGLIAPAIMAAVCFILGRSGKASRIGLYVFAGICVISEILLVRTLFGIIFVAICGAAAFALARFTKSDNIPQYSMLVLAISLLTSVFSRGDYLFMKMANTGAGRLPSDVQQIAEQLFLPYWFWGALIAAMSVAVLIFGVKAFFYNGNETKKLPKDE